jgi:hypothetical protein
MTYRQGSWTLGLVIAAALSLGGCGDKTPTPPEPRPDGGGVDGGHEVDAGDVDAGEPLDHCTAANDTDRDTVSNTDEGTGDADEDGIPNARDDDSDGDGIGDRIEAGDFDCLTPPVDTDSDGTPDFLDLDSDGDMVLDSMEGGADLDGDGVPSFRDLDSDGDGITDSVEAGDAELASPPVACDQEISPVTRTRLNPDGTPYPGDGFPDYIDTDSDNDGLADGQEIAVGSDPCNVDTDGDGVDDLFEGAYAERNCPGGVPLPGVDVSVCTCGGSAACTIPTEDFYLVLPYGGAPQLRTLEFGTTIRVADIFFITDTTGSMSGTVTNVKATVTTPGTGLIDRIGETIPDAWFGGGQHDDMPFSGWGSSPDEPFILAIRMTAPSAASAVQAAFNGIVTHGGADGPESQTFALHQIVTGAGGTWTYAGGFGLGATYFMPNYVGSCLDSGWGAPCFREAAMPIIVHFTDICSHNGPPGEDPSCDPYTDVAPVLPTWEEAIAAMNRRGAKYIGVNASGYDTCAGPTVPDGTSPCYFMKRTAEETGSVDLDGNPLVYDLPNTSSSTVFADTIAGAVQTVATRVPLDVDTGVRAEPSPLANAVMFVKRRTPGCTATPAIDPCFVPPAGTAADQAVAFIDTSTFFGVIPGTLVTFQITFQNDFFRGTDRAELFVAYIDVRGGGSAILDTRQVYIVVPANPIPFG